MAAATSERTEPAPRGGGAPLPPWAWGALGAALLAAAVLRLRGLGAHSLWSDELVSWWAVSGDGVGGVLDRVRSCMATPPLSFLVQKAAVALAGPGEWSLRLPSALAGVAAVAVVFAAGRRMFGASAAAVAALLLALHPVHLWFSTDGRPYSLAILLAAGTTWTLSALLRGAGPRAAAAHAVLTAALLHTQFIFLPFVVAQAAALLLARRAGARPPAPRSLALALGGAAVLFLPSVPQLLGIGGRASSLTWSFQGAALPGVFSFFQTTPLVLAALLTAGAWLVRRRPAAPAQAAGERAIPAADLLALLLAFLVPSLGLALAARLLDLPTLLMPRYLVASLPAAVLLVAYAVTWPPWPAGRRLFAAATLVLVFSSGVAGPLWRGEGFNDNARREDWRRAGAILEEEARAGDLILLRSGLIETEELYRGELAPGCEPYLEAPLSSFYLPSAPPLLLLPPAFDPATDPAAYHERIGRHLAGRDRIWLVMLNPPNPPGYYQLLTRYIQDVTRRPYRLGRTGNFEYLGHVTLALFEALDAGPGPGGSG